MWCSRNTSSEQDPCPGHRAPGPESGEGDQDRAQLTQGQRSQKFSKKERSQPVPGEEGKAGVMAVLPKGRGEQEAEKMKMQTKEKKELFPK